jgi:hypothetical protein
MTIPFKKLPDHLKPKAALEMLVGMDWQYYGEVVEHPGDAELRKWIPANNGIIDNFGNDSKPEDSGFVGFCAGDSANTNSEFAGKRGNPYANKIGNVSTTALLRFVALHGGVSTPRLTTKGKRRLVDAALRMNSHLSNREIARATGTSHTFVAKRRCQINKAKIL